MNQVTIQAHGTVGSFLRTVQESRVIETQLLNACKAALPHFVGHKSLVAHQLRAAIDMAECGHIPRRPLAETLQREAELVGACVDADSLEQAEVSL